MSAPGLPPGEGNPGAAFANPPHAGPQPLDVHCMLPPPDCPLCPRLCAFRAENRNAHPDWFNGAVPPFGSRDARILIVGLAPGLRGANRTGRPFTGDFAGELLFATLREQRLATGDYARRADDGLQLVDCRITNAVRCVPPGNRPTPAEVRTCGRFLSAEIAALPHLQVFVALGIIAHQAVLAALSLPRAAFAFAHGAEHRLPDGRLLTDSYHCSRQNTNTGRLTTPMFEAVFRRARAALAE